MIHWHRKSNTDGVHPSKGFTPFEDFFNRSLHLDKYTSKPPG